MANYNKSFNFKNGVQVDVDKFIVRGSLVGIGTSIPGELFDVNGNVRVAGLVTAQNLNVSGIATFSQVKVGAVQLSATSGVITATAFYGNGATLSNLPTSQWVDVDVGLGFTSIYAAGNVGVNTLDPRFSLQIGANPLQPYGASPLYGGVSPYNLLGVGINSNGNIIASGIISARSFSGIGAGLTSLNADNITVGSISESIIPVIPNSKLGPNLQLGVITATSGFIGNLTGYASTALSLQGDINILVGFVTTVNLDVGIISAQNLTTYNTFGVGIGSTVFYAAHSGKVGVGSTTPSGTVDINAAINGTLNVISRANEAKIGIGQSNTSQNYVGVLRFGNPTGVFDIINRAPGNMNFILHNGGLVSGFTTGAFNWRYGQTGQDLMTLTKDGKLGIGITLPEQTFEVVGTSTFTDTVYFGSNVIVDGTLQVTSASFGTNVADVNFNTTSGVSTFFNFDINNNLFVEGGIGFNTTFLYNDVKLDGSNITALLSNVGVGTTVRKNVIGDSSTLQVNGRTTITGGIGIGTVVPPETTNEINVYNTNINLLSTGYKGDSFGGLLITAVDTNIALNGDSNIAIGTATPQAAFDLSAIGRKGTPGTVGQPGQAYMILPKLNPSERSSLGSVSGGLIYNTNVGQMQLYNGTTWQNITHTNGSAANAGFSTLSAIAGFATYAGNVGFATFSGVSGFSTFARWSGISTIASVAGFATVASVAGFATVATQAGISTSVINGVANVTALRVSPGISTVGVLTASGSITDSIGNVRSYPQNSQSTLLSAYTLASSDAGKHVYITNTTNGVIVPSGVFTIGDQVLIVNATNGTMNVDNAGGGGAATIRLAGSTATAPHSMPAYGVGLLLCVASDTFILHGTGIV